MSGTPHTDRGHLSPETVADLREGLLDARATMAAQGHLLDCRRCAAIADGIAGVSAQLATHGEVGTLPDDVADRLDAALAAERPVHATPATTVTPMAQPQHRPPVGMRVLQAAAVIVLVLAGVGVGVSAYRGGSGADSETTSANDSAGGAAGEGANGVGYPVTRSGRNWSEATLAAAVPNLLTGSVPSSADAASPEAGSDSGGDDSTARQLAGKEVGRLAGGPPLADCVTALADGPAAPLAVDLATWQGQPAAVVLLPTPGDTASVDAWVVGPKCSQADAQLLFFARVARP